MTSIDDKSQAAFTHPNLQDIVLDADTGEINELAVVAEGEERTTFFVWLLVSCSTISGLLFGMWGSIWSTRNTDIS